MTVLLDTSGYSSLCSGQPEVARVVRRAQLYCQSEVMLVSADRHFEAVDGLVYRPIGPE